MYQGWTNMVIITYWADTIRPVFRFLTVEYYSYIFNFLKQICCTTFPY